MKKLFFIIGLLLISFILSAQNDCMGTENFNVNPAPTNGGYAPGTTVNYCVTYNNWNTGIGTNWLEGFDITIGPGWDASSITPTTNPANNGGAATGGQWIWIPGTFNGNPASSGGAGNQFGPGFFFDLNTNGQTSDDWGDFGTGPWTLCFDITVGNTVGASLSLQVSPVSDGYAGSWGTNGCNGSYNTQLSSGNTVTGCNILPSLNLVSVTDATCNGFVDGSFDVSVTNGTAPFTYTVNGVVAAIPYNNVGAGNYVVVIEDDEGCISNPLNVVVGENTTVVNNITTQQDNVCFSENDGSFTITSVNGAQPYTYNLNGIINSTGIFNNLIAGAYNVVVTDDNGCTNNIGVNITEPPSLQYNQLLTTNVDCFNANNGEIQIDGIGGTPPYSYQCNAVSNLTGLFSNLTIGNYTLSIIDDNGCTSNNFTTITGPLQDIQNNFTAIQPTCFGYSDGTISANILGGTPPYNYSWNTAPLMNNPDLFNVSAGYYQITVTDNNGCIKMFDININQPLNITLTGDNNEVLCFGKPLELLVAQQSAITPYNIVWTNTYNANQDINNSTVYPTSNGMYTATLTDASGCQQTHTLNVVVNPLPSVLFNESSTSECHPACIDFSIISPNPLYTYEWDLEPNIIQIGMEAKECYDSPGQFTVRLVAITDKGCVDSLVKPNYITINKTPSSIFNTNQPNPTDILSPVFEFTNLSEDGDNYYWNFADSEISTEYEPIHRYLQPGRYCVELVTEATYTIGIGSCADTTLNCYDINPLSLVYAPTAFTPDKDGLNDVFELVGDLVSELKFVIYTRTGLLIFQSNQLNKAWDGTYQGDLVPSGVYYYQVEYRDIDRIPKIQTGTVTLLR
jgi:gliding motility-associated-like protein